MADSTAEMMAVKKAASSVGCWVATKDELMVVRLADPSVDLKAD